MMLRFLMLAGALASSVPTMAGGSNHYACGGYCDFDMNTGRWLPDNQWRVRIARQRALHAQRPVERRMNPVVGVTRVRMRRKGSRPHSGLRPDLA
jgi:hypothetical protein